MTRIFHSIFSIVIAVAMVFTALPMGAFAETGDTQTLGQSGTITGFDYIEPIEVEKGTAEADIPFPATLTATVQLDGAATPSVTQAETISVDVVVGAWQIVLWQTYDPDTSDRYVFEAVRESLTLPDGVILPEDFFELPCVAVEISEVEVAAMATSISTTLDLSADTTQGNLETDGYCYTNNGVGSAVSLLQLKDFNFSTTDGTGILLPSNKKVQIELVGGTTNTITVNADTTPVYGISGCISAITGNGTLNVSATGTTYVTAIELVIRDSSEVSISGATVNLTASSGSSTNTALKTSGYNGPIVIKSGGTLNADGSDSSVGIGIDTSATGSGVYIGVFSGGNATTLGTVVARGGNRATKIVSGVYPMQSGLVYEESASYDGSGATSGTTTQFTPKWANDQTNKYIKMIPEGSGGTAPSITTTSLPNGTVGTAYSQTLAATGDATITWSIDSGSLPAGLTLSGNTISGTPTTAGTQTFTVKATNSAGDDAKSLSITISAAAVAPTITTTSLPNGTVGTAYSQSLAANGDTPITWSVDSGSLPAGLTLSGNTISGTPTTAESQTFTVKATNSAGNDTKSLSITIDAAPVTVTSVTIQTAPTKTTYTAGEPLDLTGLVVTLNKSDSTIENVVLADFASKNITVNPANGTALTTSNTSVTITYTPDNKSVNQAITVNAVTYTISLSANPPAGGTVSGGGSFTGGTSRTVTATANSGYKFVNWTESGNVVSTDASYIFTLTANRTLVANFVDSGKVAVEAEPVGNAPAPALPNPDAVLGAVLDSTDIAAINGGATITVSLEVKEETPDQTDKTAVENEIAADEDVGMYLDISMFKEISTGGGKQPITTLNAPIQIEFDVPDTLKALSGKTRTFSVVRVHGTTATTLPNLSGNANKILFETDQFSTYALVYKETSNPTPPPPPDRDSGSSGGGSSSYTPAPNPWLEPTPAQTLATSANKAQQDSIRTKSTETYGVRKTSWPKMKGYRYYHDTMEGNAVQVRLYVDNPTAMTRDIYVTGYVKGSFVENRKAFFEKWFSNQIRVIHMDESEPWGQNVRIAAKVDLANMDTKKLYFYAYDKKTNKYTRITEPQYRIDKNGYLHFYTELAGDIIISENLLEKK